jgi:hypothetical protein
VRQDCQPAVVACSYALARINVIVLASARETPGARVLETEFCFEQCRVACAVIYSCNSGNNRQTAHGWLFESKNPVLSQDHPVAELAISSTGDVLVSPGCPADYEAMRDRIAKLQVADSRDSDVPLASTRVAADACAGTCASDEMAEWQPDNLTPSIVTENVSEQLAASPSKGRTRPPAAVIALGAALSLTFSALIIYLDWKVPSGDADSAASSTTRSLVVAPEDLPAPAPLLKTPDSANELAASGFRMGGVVTVVPPIRKPEIPRPKREKPRAAEQRSTELATGATVVPAPVRDERRRIPGERQVIAKSGIARFRSEQNRCGQEGFWRREICKEAARWNHCHPDKWDKVPECVVQKFDSSHSMQ